MVSKTKNTLIKVLSILLAFTMVLTLFGCDTKKKSRDRDDDDERGKTEQTETVSQIYPDAEQEDWDSLEDDLEKVLTFCTKYDYLTTNSAEIIMSENIGYAIADYYTHNQGELGYGDDPLGRFSDYDYYAFDEEDIDWIITNIFNQTPDHNLDTQKMYYSNGKYYAIFSPGSFPIIDAEIERFEKQPDGSYKVYVDKTYYLAEGYGSEYEESYPYKGTVTVALKEIDGKKYWSFFSIDVERFDENATTEEITEPTTRPETTHETTTERETTTRVQATQNTPVNNSWESAYRSVLEEASGGYFSLIDVDKNGIPDLAIFDRWAQTDFVYIYMNGSPSEDDSIVWGMTYLYENSAGEYGVYRVYSNSDQYTEGYDKISFNGSRFSETEGVTHFNGYEDLDDMSEKVEYWEFDNYTNGTERTITQAEYDAYVADFESEYTRVAEYSVTDYQTNPVSLSGYVQ